MRLRLGLQLVELGLALDLVRDDRRLEPAPSRTRSRSRTRRRRTAGAAPTASRLRRRAPRTRTGNRSPPRSRASPPRGPRATSSSVGAAAPEARSSQVASGASPSIIRTSISPSSLRRPATTTSNVASSTCWKVGLTIQVPSMRPSRTEADRPLERKPRQTRRHRGGVHRGDVVRVLSVDTEHRDDDLHLVAEAVLERRSQRAVDEASGEDRRLRRSPLATEERARDLPGGVHALFDIDREREEVDPLAGVGVDARAEHLRLAVGDEHRSVGEASHAARLEGHGLVPDRCGKGWWPSAVPPCGWMGSRASGPLGRSGGGGADPQWWAAGPAPEGVVRKLATDYRPWGGSHLRAARTGGAMASLLHASAPSPGVSRCRVTDADRAAR